jgi:proline racemase
VPRIGGRAFVSGYARYVLDEDDPFPEGFVIGDIWPAAIVGSRSASLSAQRRT